MPYKYIPIEKKHTYNNMLNSLTYNGTSSVPAMLFKPVYPVTQGVTSSQRVGDKIAPSAFVLDFILQHMTGVDYPMLPDAFTPGQTYSTSGTFASGTGTITSTGHDLNGFKPVVPWHANFRLLFVKHQSILSLDTPAQCVTWFKDNFVPYTTSDPQWSNQCPLLRETTDDTGTFDILYDHNFRLSSTKSTYHFSHTFPFKGQMQFDPADPSTPTNYEYKFIILGPLSVLDADYSIKSSYGVNNVTATMFGVLKMNYIDI